MTPDRERRTALPVTRVSDAGGPGRPPGTVVIGAGPAGLAAAHELAERGMPATVLERDGQVGGLARTVRHAGYRFDIGGHRFFTRVSLIQRLWEDLAGEDFLVRPRLSRIYYRGRFFSYPLRVGNALRGLGPLESARIGASYMKARLLPSQEERNFEQWVCNRFGRRLYEIFFRSYTEKVWGIPCTEIGADWAAQRIKNLDLAAALRNAILGRGRKDGAVITTLIDSFHYPRLGPGMVWERCRDRLAERGIPVLTEREVVRLRHRDGRVHELWVRSASGEEERYPAERVISSMPLRDLMYALDPPPPPRVLEAAAALRYRDFLTVALVVDRENVFPDQWIYIHAPEVRVGRIQNFKNWSPDMVPDPSTTSLGLEYFVQTGDDLWSAPDEALVELGKRELDRLGLVSPEAVRDGTVVRATRAYPVYDRAYRRSLTVLRTYLDRLENLQVVGRNGQHRYNNQDHSMLTGIYAARNVAGAEYDIWAVNVEQAHHEEERGGDGDRLVPLPVEGRPLDAIVRSAFALYDPVAAGAAVAVVAALLLFVQTAALLLQGGPEPGATLSLLANYLFGYDVSWPGAFLGSLEAGSIGFLFGHVAATSANGLIGWNRQLLQRRLEMARTADPLLEEEEGEGDAGSIGSGSGGAPRVARPSGAHGAADRSANGPARTAPDPVGDLLERRGSS